jgi:mxaA protein
MSRLILIVMLFLMHSSGFAKESDMQIEYPRLFGYFVGDTIELNIRITTPKSLRLNQSTLPHPGVVGKFLEIKNIYVEETVQSEKSYWDINIVYQNFYVALDVHKLVIPGFDLSFDKKIISIPSWSVSISPLREVMPLQDENNENNMRPDGVYTFLDYHNELYFLLVLLATTSLMCVIVTYDRGYPPFHRRRNRIFNALYRKLKREQNLLAGGSSLSIAFKLTHQAIDASYDRSILYEDLDNLLERNPAYLSLRDEFLTFYEQSQEYFYNPIGSESKSYGYDEILKFVSALSKAEITL